MTNDHFQLFKAECHYWHNLTNGAPIDEARLNLFIRGIPFFIEEFEKLRVSFKDAKDAVQFGYDWSLEHTPTLRPYDLSDHMREALERINQNESWEITSALFGFEKIFLVGFHKKICSE